jgi:hypothetical protein
VQEAGDKNTLALSGMAEKIRAVAEEAAKLSEEEGLRNIAPRLEIAPGTVEDIEILRSLIIEQLSGIEVAIKYHLEPADGTAANAEGVLPALAGGGPVPGSGPRGIDSVLAALAPGEYVQPDAAVRHYGLPFMEAVRSRRLRIPAFADGGLVAQGASNAGSPFAGMRDFGTLNMDVGGVSGRVITTANFAEALQAVFGREASMSGRRIPASR